MMDIIVTGVMFGQEEIQIQYMDMSKQGPKSSLGETLTLELDERSERLTEEIREALIEIIDAHAVSLRNPPERIDGGNRFLREELDE